MFYTLTVPIVLSGSKGSSMKMFSFYFTLAPVDTAQGCLLIYFLYLESNTDSCVTIRSFLRAKPAVGPTWGEMLSHSGLRSDALT